jgi:AraC family transcriptional regulator
MVTEGGKNMEWVKGLQKAIDYIEDHITEDIDYAEIAKQAYSSSFHFQRVFHIICGYSIGEYIQQAIVAGRNGFIVWK